MPLFGGLVTTRYQHADLRGSPTVVSSAGGTQIERSIEQPFGAPYDGIYRDGPGFTGHATDAASGLTYMQQRYYDPVAMRFLSVDPAQSEFNRYSYGANNPFKFVDPDGRQSFSPLERTASFFTSSVSVGQRSAPVVAGALIDNTPVVGDLKGVTDFASQPSILGAVAIAVGILPLGDLAKPFLKGADKLGDLTKTEIKQIQEVVNEAGRPIEIVGSAARGDRRNVGTDLPIGKGEGTRSDIDYVLQPSSASYFEGFELSLPGLDPKTGIIPGAGNPNIGPVIRFEPNN